MIYGYKRIIGEKLEITVGYSQNTNKKILLHPLTLAFMQDPSHNGLVCKSD